LPSPKWGNFGDAPESAAASEIGTSVGHQHKDGQPLTVTSYRRGGASYTAAPSEELSHYVHGFPRVTHGPIALSYTCWHVVAGSITQWPKFGEVKTPQQVEPGTALWHRTLFPR